MATNQERAKVFFSQAPYYDIEDSDESELDEEALELGLGGETPHHKTLSSTSHLMNQANTSTAPEKYLNERSKIIFPTNTKKLSAYNKSSAYSHLISDEEIEADRLKKDVQDLRRRLESYGTLYIHILC